MSATDYRSAASAAEFRFRPGARVRAVLSAIACAAALAVTACAADEFETGDQIGDQIGETIGEQSAAVVAATKTSGPDLTWFAGTAGGGTPTNMPTADTLHIPSVDTGVEVYAVEQVIRDGAIASFDERGSYDENLWRRTARPWDFVGDGSVHDEEIWARGDDRGLVEHGYRIIKRAVTPVATQYAPVAAGAAALTDDLRAAQAAAASGDLLPVLVRIDIPPYPPLPLVAQPGTVSVADHAAMVEAQKLAATQRRQAFEASAEVASVRDVLTRDGGAVRGYLPRSRRLVATVPVDVIEDVRRLDAVAAVELDATGEAQGVPLGTMREPAYTDADRFSDSGYNGENGSSAQLIAAVAEVDGIENEVCYMDDTGAGANDDCDPSERLKKLFNCGAASCSVTGNYATADEDSHGTVVTSIIAADYRQSQGVDQGLGAGLPAGWQELATGFAREADVHYYRFSGGTSNHASAVDCARGGTSTDECTQADVFNSSNGWTGGLCAPASSTTNEDEIEDLWDSGVLPVISAGNPKASKFSTTCNVYSPADTPKAFAVGGLESDAGDYHAWDRMSYSSNGDNKVSGRGGANIEVGNVLRVGTMSVVDLAAIGEGLDYLTNDDGAYGTIYQTYGGRGTSVAAPMVAGAALMAKDWMLQNGYTWIDSPGRLHALMLAMGDRGVGDANSPTWPGCVDGDQILCGADELFGLGRLKLRLLENGQGMGPWNWWMLTKTITATSSDPYRTTPFSSGIATGAEMVKCVMQQREDMSGKDDIATIGLRLRIRDKVAGTCQVGRGNVYWTYYDALYDDKHMVTILDSDVNIEDRCLELELDRVYMSSAGSVTTHTFCYYAGVLDDEAP